MKRVVITLLFTLASWGCGPPNAVDVDEALKNIDQHLGQRLVIKARFKSGARCKQADGEWKTYCKDCQYCKGPLVVDTKLDLQKEGLADWPLVLAGTYEGQDIRCKGKLNEVKCYPLELGKLYIVQGRLEASHPPRLLVQKYWDVK